MYFNDGTQDHMQFASTEKNIKEVAALPKEIHKQPRQCERFIRDQLSKSGEMHGYRWMHMKCIQHGIVVSQDTVRLLLQLLDPIGVDQRKRRRLRRRLVRSEEGVSVHPPEIYF